MKPLDLHVENGVGVQGHTLSFPGVVGKLHLILPLDLVQTLEDSRIVRIGIQLFQRLRMEQVVVSTGQIPHQTVQTRIDLTEPAAVVDAVGDVGEFPGLHDAGVMEHIFFQNFGVQAGHAVDRHSPGDA